MVSVAIAWLSIVTAGSRWHGREQSRRRAGRQKARPDPGCRVATIAEITKQRLRQAGGKIAASLAAADVDIGFRALKIDTSNMDGKWPALKLVCSQHGLFNLFDQTGHDLLAQRHASAGLLLRSVLPRASWAAC